MVLRICSPSRSQLEGSDIVRRDVRNAVTALVFSGHSRDDAWEIVIDGFVRAVAERLAEDPNDALALATAISACLKDNVRMEIARPFAACGHSAADNLARKITHLIQPVNGGDAA